MIDLAPGDQQIDEPLPVCRAADLEQPAEDTRWLVEPLWGRAAVGFIAGQPKLGKTWLGLDLALSVATNTPCLDCFQVKDPGDVLVYLAEDQPAGVRQRLAGLCRHRRIALEDAPLHVITAPSLRLDLERDRRRLTDTVRRIRPRLLLLDPLVRLHRRDENHAGEVAELLAFLREMQRAHDLAIILVHHMRKSGAGSAGQALRGSGDFHAWTDSALYLRAGRDRTLLRAEHRNAPAPDTIELRLAAADEGADTHLEILDSSELGIEAPGVPGALLPDRLLELLRASPRPLTRIELRRMLRVNNERLGRMLADLDGSGSIVRLQHGWALGDELPKRC